MVDNQVERAQCGQLALTEASRRAWYEAMECLVDGYREVVKQKTQNLVAA